MKYQIYEVFEEDGTIFAQFRVLESGRTRSQYYVFAERWTCPLAMVFDGNVLLFETDLRIPKEQHSAMAYLALFADRGMRLDYEYVGSV